MMTARSLFDPRPTTLGLFRPDADEEQPSPLEPLPPAARGSGLAGVGPHSKLRECFNAYVLPELDIEDTTREEYENTLALWERYTNDPPADQINRVMVKSFRTKLVEQPYKRGKSKRKRSPSTVNKIMRHLSGIISPLWPADRHNPGGLGFIPFFKKIKALPRQKKLPFTFTRRELSALYLACSACKPKGGYRTSHIHNPHIWRTAIVLGLNTGPRTWDLYALKWEDIRWDDFRYGSVFYQARKNCKIQRPPLSKVARQHLEHLRSLNLDPVYVFPQFTKNGAFYRAWDRICAAAGVDAVFESFRKTCSTLHNNVVKDAGHWITGHDKQGVGAEFYDDPTTRVFRAVYRLKNPLEFRRGARALAKLTASST